MLIQMPEYKPKPEWGCDGSQLTLEAIPLSLLVGTLRDRIQVSLVFLFFSHPLLSFSCDFRDSTVDQNHEARFSDNFCLNDLDSNWTTDWKTTIKL